MNQSVKKRVVKEAGRGRVRLGVEQRMALTTVVSMFVLDTVFESCFTNSNPALTAPS